MSSSLPAMKKLDSSAGWLQNMKVLDGTLSCKKIWKASMTEITASRLTQKLDSITTGFIQNL